MEKVVTTVAIEILNATPVLFEWCVIEYHTMTAKIMETTTWCILSLGHKGLFSLYL